MIRRATLNDAALLPDIERSAGALFRAIPDLAWIAGDDVMSVEAHERIIAEELSWVAERFAAGAVGNAAQTSRSSRAKSRDRIERSRDELGTASRVLGFARTGPSTSLGMSGSSAAKVRLIAFLSAERFDQVLHIWEISVHANAQGQGVGRQLINAAIKHAHLNSLNAVTLTTFRDVGWNEPYYARLGFETLAQGALSPTLLGVLDSEIANGLPAERRCAMRLALK